MSEPIDLTYLTPAQQKAAVAACVKSMQVRPTVVSNKKPMGSPINSPKRSAPQKPK